MDLLGENRALVQMGLAEIGKTENIGLRVLIEEAGLSDKAISEYHIGFIIGPVQCGRTARKRQACGGAFLHAE